MVKQSYVEKRSSYRLEDQIGCFVCRDCGQLKDLDEWHFILKNEERVCKECFDGYDIIKDSGEAVKA